MKKIHSFVSTNGNHYIVDVENKIIQLLHPEFAKVRAMKEKELPEKSENYYERKYAYWKAHNVLQNKDINHHLKLIDGDFVRRNFISTPQIVFEVTDRCNLKCKYCGYGEMYTNHDRRNTKNADVNVAKKFLDYYFEACEKSRFVNEKLSFGFYGGEPLLHFEFVKEIVEYIEKRYGRDNPYPYYITTNGLYVDRYIEFLAGKNFNLLISLDGDAYASSYRVDYIGNPAFDKVVENILFLKEKYPDYYASHVDFSTVLHDRNSIDGVISFFETQFQKIPIVGSLNPLGIDPQKKELFASMYNTNFEMNEHEICNDERPLPIVTSSILKHTRFLHNTIFSFYKNYLNLITDAQTEEIIPTATCYPFGKKIYITVNGKILPCERIGHELSLGTVAPAFVKLDFGAIAELYNTMYKDSYEKQCVACSLLSDCYSCIFHIRLSGCPSFRNREKYSEYVKEEMDFLESHRDLYKYLKMVMLK